MLPLCCPWERVKHMLHNTTTRLCSACMENKVLSLSFSILLIMLTCLLFMTPTWCDHSICCQHVALHVVWGYSGYSHTSLISCLVSLLLLHGLRDFDHVPLFSLLLTFPVSISVSVFCLHLSFSFCLCPSVSRSLPLWLLVPMVTGLRCVLFCCYGNRPTVGILLPDLCVPFINVCACECEVCYSKKKGLHKVLFTVL